MNDEYINIHKFWYFSNYKNNFTICGFEADIMTNRKYSKDKWQRIVEVNYEKLQDNLIKTVNEIISRYGKETLKRISRVNLVAVRARHHFKCYVFNIGLITGKCKYNYQALISLQILIKFLKTLTLITLRETYNLLYTKTSNFYGFFKYNEFLFKSFWNSHLF